jgi:hypothetical protein
MAVTYTIAGQTLRSLRYTRPGILRWTAGARVRALLGARRKKVDSPRTGRVN